MHKYCDIIVAKTRQVFVMSSTTNLSIRIDRDLKDDADQLFNALGMNLTTAITIFVRQAVMQKKIPFEIALKSDEGATSRQVAIEALDRIQLNSINNGTDKMTLDEINAIIKASRADRKARAAKA